MWIGGNSAQVPFAMFSGEHWLTIGFFLFVLLLIYLFRQTLSGFVQRKHEVGVAISLLIFEIAYQFWLVLTENWHVSHALPLELSNISVLLVIILLLTRNKLVFEIVFLVGIGGALQAIFTPVLNYGFPHFRFIHFFYTHMLVIWVVFYFMWCKGYLITLFSVVKAMIFMNILLPFIYLANVLVEGNYWFIITKPSGGSLLDYLGPHPWYILGMEAAALVFFLLLWLVFGKKKS